MRDWRDHVTDTVRSRQAPGRRLFHPPYRLADLGVGAGDRGALAVAAGRRAAGNRFAFGAALRLHDPRARRELHRRARCCRPSPTSTSRGSAAPSSRSRSSAAPGGRVIYHSSDSFNPAPGTHADATADLFSVRTQDFSRVASEVHRFTASPPRSGRGPRRPRCRFSRRRPDNRRQSSSSEHEPLRRPPGTGADGTTLPLTEGHGDASELAIDSRAPVRLARGGGGRRPARNLLVSSSILGVLGASMGLLVLATRRAQRLAQQQMEFVAAVSHELRTPLAVIRSAAENLADGVVDDEAQCGSTAS